jgi:hypothetical protein
LRWSSPSRSRSRRSRLRAGARPRGAALRAACPSRISRSALGGSGSRRLTPDWSPREPT